MANHLEKWLNVVEKRSQASFSLSQFVVDLILLSAFNPYTLYFFYF